jgi:ankyrin repeat protein
MGSLAAVRLLLEKKRGSDSAGGAGGRSSGGDRSVIGPACDVNAFSSSKCTALHIATRHRYMEIVKLLLQVPCKFFRPPPSPS